MEPLYNPQISQDLDNINGILASLLGIGSLAFTGVSAIVSLFVPWLFMIFTVFSCKNDPNYGRGNYYAYRKNN